MWEELSVYTLKYLQKLKSKWEGRTDKTCRRFCIINNKTKASVYTAMPISRLICTLWCIHKQIHAAVYHVAVVVVVAAAAAVVAVGVAAAAAAAVVGAAAAAAVLAFFGRGRPARGENKRWRRSCFCLCLLQLLLLLLLMLLLATVVSCAEFSRSDVGLIADVMYLAS